MKKFSQLIAESKSDFHNDVIKSHDVSHNQSGGAMHYTAHNVTHASLHATLTKHGFKEDESARQSGEHGVSRYHKGGSTVNVIHDGEKVHRFNVK